MGSHLHSWLQDSAHRARSLWRDACRSASWTVSKPSRRTRSVFCCSRQSSRPVTPRFYGGQHTSSASRDPPSSRPRRPACSRLGPPCGFAIRWCARRCTGLHRLSSGGRRTARWLAQPTNRPIRTAARGTSPRRRLGLMKTSPPSSSAPPDARRRAEDSSPPPHCWNEPSRSRATRQPVPIALSPPLTPRCWPVRSMP